MTETKSSLFNKCVFIKDCKVRYRGIGPPCYALVEKITSTNKQSKRKIVNEIMPDKEKPSEIDFVKDSDFEPHFNNQ